MCGLSENVRRQIRAEAEFYRLRNEKAEAKLAALTFDEDAKAATQGELAKDAEPAKVPKKGH